MREKEFKKHIATSWNNCSDINPEEDVWRLELSMKGNKHRLRVEIWREAVTMNDLKEKKYCLKKEVLKMDNKGKNKIDLCDCEMLEAENALTEFNEKKIVPSGFILFRCVRFEDLFEGDFLKNLYFTAIYQNFKFVVNNGTKNKTRMKDVELFDEICEYNKILSISESKDATRSNRIFIKHLHKHIQDLKGMNDVLIEDTKGGTDLDIFSPAILIEAIEQMEELKTLLTGGEKLLVNYSKAYDLIKYLQKIKQINQ